MSFFKGSSSNIRNVDLLRTYYSGEKTPVKKEKLTFPRKKKFFSYKLWLRVAALFTLIAGAVIIGYRPHAEETNIIEVGKNAAILPLKHNGRSSYYNYGQIKNSPTIILEPQNTCAIINLGSITDLTAATISFSARGENGTEKVAIILRDVQRMSNANRDDIILTPSLPKDKWQTFNIKLKDIYVPLDKSRVTQIRFDNSYNLTKNDLKAKAYIKNIVIE